MGCTNAKAAEPQKITENGNSVEKEKSSKPNVTSKQSNKPNGDPFARAASEGKTVITVMGKYTMSMAKEDLMGEGTSSICRKGTNNDTKETVAIKVYKATKESAKHEDVKLQKFKRQISVLTELQEAFKRPSDSKLWCESLANTKPARLFMSLIDYSKDAKGEPGPDTSDGVLYVITELAQYSLKDYLALRRDQNRPLPPESVRNITKAIILVVAGLHAKNLVHIDLKPENLMMFNGRLKLIDVDGCVRAGTSVSIQDSSISFSPCYCAPEWARFLIEDSESRIVVTPALDVWSVGMTICELVTLDAILKPMYANFLRNGHSHREAGFLFMDWLSNIKKAPFPKPLEKFDKDLYDLLSNWLLVCDPRKRKTLAQCLSAQNSYISAVKPPSESDRMGTRESVKLSDGMDIGKDDNEQLKLYQRTRIEDTTNMAPLFQGTLWKLNSNGDPQDPSHWLKRDMWIAANGSLAYFSLKDGKRLVLFDGSKLGGAIVEQFTDTAKPYAFKVRTKSEKDDLQYDETAFACDSEQEYVEWTSRLRSTAVLDVMPRVRLGQGLADDLKVFKLNVKNRRLKADGEEEAAPASAFKGVLWKVKADGDATLEDHWFEREMWIARNGSLVYFSKKEDRNLIYYTADDLANATYSEIPDEDSCRPWAFRIQLKGSKDIEFSPGEFAASNRSQRDDWMRELRKCASSGR